MTEREIEARLRNERISLPDGFEARQEAALRRVMAKRECVLPKRMAWLAAALVLMMSAAAIAAGGRGLAFFWRQASPEAERLVEKGIAQSGGQLDAAEFVVREAVYDGSVLQAVVAVQGKENRRAVMLGDDGNVSADAVLVDVGEDGEIETAREEDGVLLVYIRQEMRTAENELHVVWPCFASVADADGLSWSSPQMGTLVFDVPRTAPQTLDMQMRVELEHALTLTHIAVETTPLGATLTISYQPGERLKAAMPEFDVEDGARVVAERMAGQRIVVSFARNGLAEVARQLADRLNDSSWGVRATYGGRAVDSRALNLVVVPNEVAEDDGYALHAGVVEQHVTPDVCEPLFKVAPKQKDRNAQEAILGAMLKELLVKQDVVDERVTAFDLDALDI